MAETDVQVTPETSLAEPNTSISFHMEAIDPIEQDDTHREGISIKMKPATWLQKIFLYFLMKKQKSRHQRVTSLVSRNQRCRGGFHGSMKRMKTRALSVISLSSTNLRSRANSMDLRSRHTSAVDAPSVAERIEAFNEAHELPVKKEGRTRKVSKVSCVCFQCSSKN